MNSKIIRRTILAITILAGSTVTCVSLVSAFSTTCGRFLRGVGGYSINPNFRDSTAGTLQQQIDAVNLGAFEWAINGGARMDWVYGGTTETTAATADTDNVVFSTNASGGSVLAEAFCYHFSGERFFDIRFYDGNHRWNYDSSGGRSGFDIAGIACHEFGHALGLGHSSAPGSTMWPSSLGDGVANRSIESDDIAGIQFLYGEALPIILNSFTPNSGSVAGGTQVTLIGENFHPGVTDVLVGGEATLVISLTGTTEMVVRTPAGTALGPVDVTLTDRFLGDTVHPNLFTYTEAPARINWSGLPWAGREVEIEVQGPPGAKYGIASSEGRGTFTWRQFDFCLGNNIQPFMKSLGSNPTDPPLDAAGFARKSFSIPESASLFEEFSFHGVVMDGGELVLTNKAIVQVLGR